MVKLIICVFIEQGSLYDDVGDDLNNNQIKSMCILSGSLREKSGNNEW